MESKSLRHLEVSMSLVKCVFRVFFICLSAVEKAFDEDDLVEKNETGGDFTPVPGGPFSSLIPSLWPQKILKALSEVCPVPVQFLVRSWSAR